MDEATLLFVLVLGLIALCWWRLEVGSAREREVLLWLVAAAVRLGSSTHRTTRTILAVSRACCAWAPTTPTSCMKVGESCAAAKL